MTIKFHLLQKWDYTLHTVFNPAFIKYYYIEGFYQYRILIKGYVGFIM